jgi:hypothetical protein
MCVMSFFHQVQAVCADISRCDTRKCQILHRSLCHSVVRISHFAIPSVELQVSIFVSTMQCSNPRYFCEIKILSMMNVTSCMNLLY